MASAPSSQAPVCSAAGAAAPAVQVAGRRRVRLLHAGLVALLGVVCAGLLAANTLQFVGAAFGGLPGDRRYWDDTAMAVGFYFEGLRMPQTAADRSTLEAFQETIDVYRRLVKNRVRVEGIGPEEFWRTIRPRSLVREQRPHVVPPFEDPGRALVLAAGWHVLGGISPYLLVWLAVLLALPVLLWIAWELISAGHGGASFLVPLLLAASPYVVQTLALPHSAVGFYLIALLALLALAVHALLAPAPAPWSFLARVAMAGIVFAVCAASRSGTAAQLPAFLLTVVVGAWRSFPPARRPAGAVLAATLFCLPYVSARPAQQHNQWVAVWEGLGDFDTSKQYYWSDPKAREAVKAAGGVPFGDPKTVDAQAESILRAQVLADVRTDPAWFAQILAKRVLATLSQAKLAPWGPRDGYSVEWPRYHYRYTRTVDWLGVGRTQVELPLPLLWTPTFVLAAVWMLSRRRLVPLEADRLGRVLAVLGIVGLATLPVPVLISTAAGIETQAFALVYLLGAAWLAAELLTAAARPLIAAGARGHDRT